MVELPLQLLALLQAAEGEAAVPVGLLPDHPGGADAGGVQALLEPLLHLGDETEDLLPFLGLLRDEVVGFPWCGLGLSAASGHGVRLLLGLNARSKARLWRPRSRCSVPPSVRGTRRGRGGRSERAPGIAARRRREVRTP